MGICLIVQELPQEPCDEVTGREKVTVGGRWTVDGGRWSDSIERPGHSCKLVGQNCLRSVYSSGAGEVV